MSARPETAHADTTSCPREIVMFSGPGCEYSFALRAGLRRVGLAYREINIWEDQAAATLVRSVANGNETVPTVVAGDVHVVNRAPDMSARSRPRPAVRRLPSADTGSAGPLGLEGRRDPPRR